MEQESKAVDWRISARIDYGSGKDPVQRNCDMRKVPSRQRMDLLTFISSDSESLLLTGKTIQSRRGLPTSSQQQEDLCGPSRKNPAQRDIQENARRDQYRLHTALNIVLYSTRYSSHFNLRTLIVGILIETV
ncbi:Protein TIC [Trichinella spiralis]|uniref:Protein TIC n=1 Tax=Trichinella spiralis TaxID=6334 RepID=A0ABR3KMI8_TRISP